MGWGEEEGGGVERKGDTWREGVGDRGGERN